MMEPTIQVTQLIKLKDGIVVEATVPVGKTVKPVAGGQLKPLTTSIDQIEPLLLKICKPFVNTFNALNQDMKVDQAEIEIGFSFQGSGDLYIVKGSGEASLKVTLTIKPAYASSEIKTNEQTGA